MYTISRFSLLNSVYVNSPNFLRLLRIGWVKWIQWKLKKNAQGKNVGLGSKMCDKRILLISTKNTLVLPENLNKEKKMFSNKTKQNYIYISFSRGKWKICIVFYWKQQFSFCSQDTLKRRKPNCTHCHENDSRCNEPSRFI